MKHAYYNMFLRNTKNESGHFECHALNYSFMFHKNILNLACFTLGLVDFCIPRKR
jgi:hypothetical protein